MATLTCLQEYLNLAANRPRPGDIPCLPEYLSRRVRNAVTGTQDNNDLLEFIGDRVVNFVTACFVDRVKVCKGHHVTVRSVICNNDTFGRLAFYLHLERGASFDYSTAEAIRDWNPQLANPPPKALADLFEALVGAVYVHHGLKRTSHWLEALFTPIIKVATSDYWFSSKPLKHLENHHDSSADSQSHLQQKVLQCLSLRGGPASACGPKTGTDVFGYVLDDLPFIDDVDLERLEVASQLINLIICKVAVSCWPIYHKATSKVAGLLTEVTRQVNNEYSLGHIGSMVKMVDLDPNSNVHKDPSRLHAVPRSVIDRCNYYKRFKAFLGWFHFYEPAAAEAWIESLLKPHIILRHDMIVRDRRRRPPIPPGCYAYARDPPSLTTRATEDDEFDSILDGLRSLDISTPTAAKSLTITLVTRSEQNPVPIDEAVRIVPQLEGPKVNECLAKLAAAAEKLGLQVTLPEPEKVEGRLRLIQGKANDEATLDSVVDGLKSLEIASSLKPDHVQKGTGVQTPVPRPKVEECLAKLAATVEKLGLNATIPDGKQVGSRLFANRTIPPEVANNKENEQTTTKTIPVKVTSKPSLERAKVTLKSTLTPVLAPVDSNIPNTKWKPIARWKPIGQNNAQNCLKALAHGDEAVR